MQSLIVLWNEPILVLHKNLPTQCIPGLSRFGDANHGYEEMLGRLEDVNYYVEDKS